MTIAISSTGSIRFDSQKSAPPRRATTRSRFVERPEQTTMPISRESR
jgi:hypothetical protein